MGKRAAAEKRRALSGARLAWLGLSYVLVSTFFAPTNMLAATPLNILQSTGLAGATIALVLLHVERRLAANGPRAGEMHDDPVAFAIKDRCCLAVLGSLPFALPLPGSAKLPSKQSQDPHSLVLFLRGCGR
jgi:hypothetical protein